MLFKECMSQAYLTATQRSYGNILRPDTFPVCELSRMSGDSQVCLSIRCSHTASRMPPGHPHAYVLRGDGHFTTTPGRSGLEPGELEERTKRRNNEFNLCRERLMQRKHSRECWSQTVLGSHSLPWKSLCVSWCPHL